MNHEQAETRVLEAIPVLAKDQSIEECIAQLQASGLSEVRATKLCVMIPEAFGLALAWRLGAALPDEEQMFDVHNRAGETVQVPMLGQHVFFRRAGNGGSGAQKRLVYAYHSGSV